MSVTQIVKENYYLRLFKSTNLHPFLFSFQKLCRCRPLRRYRRGQCITLELFLTQLTISSAASQLNADMVEDRLRPRILLTARIPEHQLAPLPVFSHHVCGGDPQNTTPFPAPLDELTWRRQKRAFLATHRAHAGLYLLHAGDPVFFEGQHPLTADLVHVFLAAIN